MDGEAMHTPPAETAPACCLVPDSTRILVAGHDLAIFVESPPLLAAMLEDIRTALRRVWLEAYIFLDDAGGRAVADALAERARAGVDVRLLYDAIGCRATSATLFQGLQHAGVRVHGYHSIWEALWRFTPFRILNRRDHRKLLIIDDRVGYFGGMNIVDPSRAASPRGEREPAAAGWRDVHVRLAGPQQAELAESFDRSWRRAHGEKLRVRPRAYRLARLAEGQESIQFFDSGPGRRYTRAARVFTQLIRASRTRLTFSMAYFVPVGQVLRALLRAPRRGVSIRVVVPGQSDVPLVQRATAFLYNRLLRRRIHVYERQVNMLHSKVMIVDDQWTVVGSANVDARSLYLSLEFVAVIHSRNLALVMNRIVSHEIEHSRRITLREYRQRRWWQRLIDRLAWELRWWL